MINSHIFAPQQIFHMEFGRGGGQYGQYTLKQYNILLVCEQSYHFVQAIALTIMECLDKHDAEDPDYRHQAMVLTQTIRDQNAAELFQQAYEQHKQESESLGATLAEWDRFEAYHGESDQKVLERFDAGEFRGLVVVGKLREGYDNNRISVVGIARNVSLSSKVLFAQFVGRAVRKLHPDDPVTATIISHPKYKQRRNYEEFDKVREGEDIEEED